MVRGKIAEVISFYQGQLRKFNKIGRGNKTEFDVVVTKRLVDITKKRLTMLSHRRLKLLKTTDAAMKLKKHMKAIHDVA